MEASYYNVTTPCNDRVIVYNTRRRSIAELTAEEAQMIEHIDSCPDQSLVEALAEEGFVVNSAETEADEMLYRQHQYRNNSHMFELTITLSRMCNFCCDYCYVPTRPGVMSDETQDAIVKFIEYNYAESPFKELRINWYGGEPLLQVDAMERLSAPIIAFCREREIKYIGHILSNASLADAPTCERLVKNCGITSLMLTLSGYGDMQDYQRPARNGKKYFDTIIENIDYMLDAGIQVHVNYVTNQNNVDECTRLCGELCHKKDIKTRFFRTYSFDKECIHLKDGKDTPMQLFTPEEFGPYLLKSLRVRNLDASGYENVLKPIPLHCAALVNRAFFIDETGDVTCCMVDMDYPDRVLFNVGDWAEGRQHVNFSRFLEYANLEPTRDLECRSCRILPLCQGGCYQTYLDTGTLSCHDLKYCIEDVVADYYKVLTGVGQPDT